MNLADKNSSVITPLPVVSVLVCTRNRPDHLERAVASVLTQASDEVEIIVIDHSASTPLRQPEIDESVRRLSIGDRTRGAARQRGLLVAQGQLIVYCDDTDIWLPGHLLQLRSALEAEPLLAAVYGTSTWVDEQLSPLDIPEPDQWPYGAQTPFISAGAMMHRAWPARRLGGFDVYANAFAEWDLLIRMSDWWPIRFVEGATVLREWDSDHHEVRYGVEQDRGRIARNAMGRRIRHPRHTPLRKSRREPREFDRATWRDERKELTVHSVFSGRHSYASVNAGLLPALEEQGISLFLSSATSSFPPDADRYQRAKPSDRRMSLFYEVGSRPRDVGVEPLLQYTMVEQDLLALVHVEEINRYVNLLFVPCRMNAESFAHCGVTVPIQILHHGVDPTAFPLLERPQRDLFTFGTFGQQNERKGIDVLLRAFRDEFAPSDPVRLVLNATLSGMWVVDGQANVEVRTGFLDHEGLLNFLNELDAFVLPSRGEGFGLCGLEAMATGLPLIATNWSGPAEYLDPIDSFPLEYGLTDTSGYDFAGMRLFGRWAEPSYEHLRHLMRYLFENREAGIAAGRRASRRIRAEWTWERPAKQIVDCLDAFAAGVVPPSSL